MNKVILMGRLTARPELKYTQNSIPVTSFTVAVNRPVKDGQTDFIDVVAWRQTAEFICKYFDKGRMIAVEGSIQVRNYEDKGGNKRKAVEVVAANVYFAGDKPKGAWGGGASTSNEPIDPDGFEEIPEPDDLPF